MKPQYLIDNDPEQGYELTGPFKKAVDIILTPILNNLPKFSRGILSRTHRTSADIIQNVTTHKALETLYHHKKKFDDDPILKRFFRFFWSKTNNSKAVRNRLKLVKRELRKKILEISKNPERKHIKILSIASGSSRAIFEVLADLKKVVGQDVEIEAVFLDKSPEAIAYSKDLASHFETGYFYHWVNDTIGNYIKESRPEEEFDIVEMVGLLDYFKDEKAIQVFSAIHKMLKNDGIMITANIDENFEQKFVTKVLGWEMIYRPAKDLIKLANEAGFEETKMMAYYEPIKIHCVLVAQK